MPPENPIKVLVTGSSGQLGQALQIAARRFPQLRLALTDRATLDITDPEQLRHRVTCDKPQLIINCAAYTAVDQAEAEPEQAFSINSDGVGHLATLAAALHIPLLHISTDYVFGEHPPKPINELAIPAPLSVYGVSKLAGEQAMLKSGCGGAIIRTSWLYSEYGKNFVKTILQLASQRSSLKVVNDQQGSPTYAGDLADALLQLVVNLSAQQLQPAQIWHYANAGQASWYELAKAIVTTAAIDCQIEPIASSEYPCAANRPRWSVLATDKIQAQLAAPIPHWRESLQHCLTKLAKAKGDNPNTAKTLTQGTAP